MRLNARLNAVERERGRRCVNCGGPIVTPPPPRPKTWREVAKDLSDLSDEERIAMAAHLNRMHMLPPRHQELAYRLYCQQQGMPCDGRNSPYSSPNPPPAPFLPESGPMPKLPPRWG